MKPCMCDDLTTLDVNCMPVCNITYDIATENVTNNISTTPSPVFVDEDSERIEHALNSFIVPFVFGLVTLIGLVGNLLVVIVILRYQQMRNTTNILIICLALADLSFIFFCVPFTAVEKILQVWPFGDVWCRVARYFMFTTAYLSVYTLTVMSIDRYLAVVHPISSMAWRTKKNTFIAISVTWTVLIVGNAPTLYYHREITYPFLGGTRTNCFNFAHLLSFYLIFLILSYIVPLAIIATLYSIMLWKMNRTTSLISKGQKQQQATAGGSNDAKHSKADERRRKVTQMVVAVVAGFAICWLPIHIFFMVSVSMDGFKLYQAKFFIYHAFAQCMAYANSCINPILYVFMSSNFRDSFRSVIFCGKLQKNSGKNAANTEMTMVTRNVTKLGEKADCEELEPLADAKQDNDMAEER